MRPKIELCLQCCMCAMLGAAQCYQTRLYIGFFDKFFEVLKFVFFALLLLLCNLVHDDIGHAHSPHRTLGHI